MQINEIQTQHIENDNRAFIDFFSKKLWNSHFLPSNTLNIACYHYTDHVFFFIWPLFRHKWAKMTKILQLAIPYWLLLERGFKGCQSLFFSIELKRVSLEQCVNHFTPEVMGRILSERSPKLSEKISNSLS